LHKEQALKFPHIFPSNPYFGANDFDPQGSEEAASASERSCPPSLSVLFRVVFSLHPDALAFCSEGPDPRP